MQLSAIEQQVVAAMHDLPLDKQQFILEFSRSIRAATFSDTQAQQPKRQAGLGKGKGYIREDFDGSLPNEFLSGGDTPEKSQACFPPTTLSEVSGLFKNQVTAKTDEEIEVALLHVIAEKWRESD